MRERRATRWRSLRKTMARLRLRLRRTGKGWPWSTASGVSTGHTLRLKCVFKKSLLLGVELLRPQNGQTRLGAQLGRDELEKIAIQGRHHVVDARGDRRELLSGNIPSAPLRPRRPPVACLSPATRHQ